MFIRYGKHKNKQTYRIPCNRYEKNLNKLLNNAWNEITKTSWFNNDFSSDDSYEKDFGCKLNEDISEVCQALETESLYCNDNGVYKANDPISMTIDLNKMSPLM